jgi:hypothetical protein
MQKQMLELCDCVPCEDLCLVLGEGSRRNKTLWIPGYSRPHEI